MGRERDRVACRRHIARQIIETSHGGALDVESILGEGTEFMIRLPILDKMSVESAIDL
ncbi:hypothetical protein [Microcoleus sp. herbarium12]|uniref:hypothetical protein n=1 Tax=Microcoleus sp. herbarium12 TaxID=3055437 RepID=UPI002FD6FEAB